MKQIKRKELRTLRREKSESYEQAKKESKAATRIRNKKQKMRSLLKKEREVQRVLADQHRTILEREKACKNLMKDIKEVKERQRKKEDKPSVENLEKRVVRARQEIEGLKAEKEQREKKWKAEMESVDSKIEETRHEIRVVTLKEQEKGQELRMADFRKKELEKLIREWKKEQTVIEKHRMQKEKIKSLQPEIVVSNAKEPKVAPSGIFEEEEEELDDVGFFVTG